MINKLKALGRDPRFHGNGFTQLYLNENQRLHVWHPSLPPLRAHNATIHDHIWDMESEVLMGLLIQREFDVHAILGSEFKVYAVDQEAVRSNTPSFYRPLEQVGLHQANVYGLAEGSFYTFPARAFHSSDAVGLTATLMTKGPDKFKFPRIIAPAGEPPVNAFDPAHTPNIDTLWGVIEEAINTMPTAAYRKLRGVLEQDRLVAKLKEAI